jgi:hypothetical protein
MTWILVKRILRGAVAAFLAGVTMQLASGTNVSSIEDLKKLGLSLFAAGITGLLLGLDKLLRYREDQGPTESSQES